jgi:Tfp pilus assembly protein PilF
MAPPPKTVKVTRAKATPAKPAASPHRERIKQGVQLQQAGKLDQATAIYQEVLRQDANNADAWHFLGVAALERRMPENGRELIERSLQLKPDNAIYHHNMAAALAELGDLENAETHYREAVRLKPDYAEAYYNLTGSIKVRAGDPAIEKVAALLQNTGVSPQDRCFLHFAAGKIYDDIGAYDRAFAHYEAGNLAKDVRFRPEEYWRQVAALIATFDAGFLETLFGQGSSSEVPVFIVGMPRSGTSLAEQVLASHPAVFGAGELPDLPAITEALPKHGGGRSYPACVPALGPEAIRGFANAYLGRLSKLAPEAQRVVDKQPLNFQHVGLIALMFPNARIIHCRRNVLDTCVSCYFQNFTNGQEYSFDLIHLGLFHRCYERLMAHWDKLLPGRIMDVHYEELVADHEGVTRAMLEFCGLDWNDACAAPHETDRPVKTASRWQVRQPVYKTSLARWRRYEKHLGPLLAALKGGGRRGEGGMKN